MQNFSVITMLILSYSICLSIILQKQYKQCFKSFPNIKRLKTKLMNNLKEDDTLSYSWRNKWYAVCFEENLPIGNSLPMAYSIYSYPLVLWRDLNNEIRCVQDHCPHRSAKLSEGRIRDGNIECLYHGWQFKGDTGACVKIPQLEMGASIPSLSCITSYPIKVHEEIVWVYLNPNAETLPSLPSTINNELGNDLLLPKKQRKFTKYDFQIDLPYEHSYLVENLIDPAHISISHDRTSGGGKRENAQAYDMIVDEDSFNENGFTGRFRETRIANKTWTEIKMDAPGIVRYRTEVIGKNDEKMKKQKQDVVFAAALHCMPMAEGRSRLLFRTYYKGLPWLVNMLVNLKPLWLRHLNSCKILEQDVGLITTQEDWILSRMTTATTTTNDGSKGSLSKDYLPIKSSDALVVAYRKWLDKVGNGMPWAIGWKNIIYQRSNISPTTSTTIKETIDTNIQKTNDNNINAIINHRDGIINILAPGLNIFQHRSTSESRYYRHVIHSIHSRNALKNIKILKNISSIVGIGLFFISNLIKNVLKSKVCLSVSFLLWISWIGFYKLEERFYINYNRKEDLANNKI